MSDELRARLRSLPVLPETLPGFDPGSAPAAPEELFLDWLEGAVAAGTAAPHAAVLATVDAGGPSARVLMLRDLDAAGWLIATPAGSRPGAALAASGRAALVFFWPVVGRQVRVEGEAVRVPDDEAAADFRARPAAARAPSLVGRPSPVLAGDDEYAAALAAALALTEADPLAVPEDWALWRIAADAVEFWQAAAGGAHIRLRYRRDGGAWMRERLWP